MDFAALPIAMRKEIKYLQSNGVEKRRIRSDKGTSVPEEYYSAASCLDRDMALDQSDALGSLCSVADNGSARLGYCEQCFGGPLREEGREGC